MYIYHEKLLTFSKQCIYVVRVILKKKKKEHVLFQYLETTDWSF